MSLTCQQQVSHISVAWQGFGVHDAAKAQQHVGHLFDRGHMHAAKQISHASVYPVSRTTHVT